MATGIGRGSRAGVGELLACNFQRSLDPRRLRMRFAEYEFIRMCDGLERLHTFAEIVERGAIVPVERLCITPPHPERVIVPLSQNASRHGYIFAHERLGLFEAL